jgi:hypothetical protein
MNTPVVTDVFKFLATRPAQRFSEKETAQSFVRDQKAANSHGAHQIEVLARKLSPPSAAQAHWNELDLSTLAPLEEGYRALVRSYQELPPDDDPPTAKSMLQDASLDRLTDGAEPKALDLVWEALYTAHATGPDAGRILETPMAVLRLLHFAALMDDLPKPSRSAALSILRATVVVPTAFDSGFHPQESRLPTPLAPAAVTSQASPEDARRSEQIHALVTDLGATQGLLASVSAAGSVARQETLDPGEWSARFHISTIPHLGDVLRDDVPREQSAILDRLSLARTTSAPQAAQTLQLHLQGLVDRATLLEGDAEFETALNKATLALPLEIAPIVAKNTSPAPITAPDVDVSGRITPLGIGDLKVVKQTLLSYVAGEVAHIENVLQGESKERTHRKLDRTEITIFTAEENTTDTERDTQTTDRFELKREAEQTVKEDMSIKAGLTVTASYGPIVATATGDFAYSTSKQDSQKNSSNFARDVVDKSVTKVQTKTRSERTTKTLNEVEEINKHVLDNGPPSVANVTGVYRWVDKRYRAQVYNYGARLLLEFIVPEPAAFYRATHLANGPKVNATPPPPFVTVSSFNVAPGAVGLGKVGLPRPLTAEDITEINYRRYAARYGAAGVLGPPPMFTYIGLALAQTKELGLGADGRGAVASKDFVVPAGYLLGSYSVAASILWSLNAPQFNLQVRGDVWEIIHSPDNAGGAPMMKRQIGAPAVDNTHVAGSVPVSLACYDVYSYAINIQGVCVRTEEAMIKWRLDTFGQIQTAYQALQAAYDQKVTQAESAAGIAIEGQNPAINRIVEKNELKKLCVTMMTGQHFKQFGAVTEPFSDPLHPPEVDVLEALYEGPIVQFFEQAFEWEQMTYLYYPYFWGRKSNWAKVTNLSDPDPLFQQFLTAGSARVLVPVPLAYVDSVRFLLQNPLKETELRKKVWRGGDAPLLKDPLYESIAEELRNQTDDLAGATPEGDPWEFTLPTTLVWLQPDGTLPTFP